MPVLTRRGAMAQKCILNLLPTELTTEIISLCDSDSQAALCRVSKSFNQLGQRLLYCVVALYDVRSRRAFDKAVSRHPQYATWVRRLNLVDVDGNADLKATNRILQKTTELRRLALEWSSPFPSFKTFSFPHLHHLSLMGYFSLESEEADFTAFLNRHSTISYLLAFLFEESTGLRPSGISADLPNLITYQGTSLTFLANAPKLQSADIIIGECEALDALGRFSSCQNLEVNYVPELDDVSLEIVQDILNRVQHHLPHLTSFLLKTSFELGILSYRKLLDGGLSGLKQLEFLGLSTLEEQYISAEHHQSMIDSMIQSRPNLQECSLGLGENIYRYKVVNGKALAKTELCRLETI
ncbi:hypothetical protein C8J56DRAFT_963543, partial [Mycena floridula]